METLLGLRGPDFVMVVADSLHANQIIALKTGKLQFSNLT